MKLLFDENLSRSLVGRLADIFPGSAHVVPLGLGTATDREIAEYARKNDFVIVTKDSDFNLLIAIDDTLPGVIWIRAGNCSSRVVENLIRQYYEQISDIATTNTVRLLMLF